MFRRAVTHSAPEKHTVLEVVSPTSIMCKSDKNSGSSKNEIDRHSVPNQIEAQCFFHAQLILRKHLIWEGRLMLKEHIESPFLKSGMNLL